MDEVRFRVLNNKCIPTLNSNGLYDLISNVDITLYPHNQCLVDSGIIVDVIDNVQVNICNTILQACNGVIIPINLIITKTSLDTIKIILVNNGIDTYRIRAGITKIAQFSVVQSYIGQISFQECNNDKN